MNRNDALIGAIYAGANLSSHGNYFISLDAFEAVLKEHGLAVVPLKVTPRMCAAGGPEVRKACGLQDGDGNMQTIWTAMVEASK